jgi:hypothetical protein
MIFEIRVTAIIKVDTNDYKEMEPDAEEPSQAEVCESLVFDWDEGVLDIGELLEDPESLAIEIHNP